MTLPPFEQVIDRHGPAVLRVCRAVAGPDDAEDAWSETFLAALAAYPELRPDSNVRAWLVTVAHRKAIDQVRARKRAPLPVDPPPVPGTAAPPPEPDDELWREVADLPDRQRTVLACRYVADLPYAEIGRIVGSSEAAARRAAADGIASLRKRLTGKEDQP